MLSFTMLQWRANVRKSVLRCIVLCPLLVIAALILDVSQGDPNEYRVRPLDPRDPLMDFLMPRDLGRLCGKYFLMVGKQPEPLLSIPATVHFVYRGGSELIERSKLGCLAPQCTQCTTSAASNTTPPAVAGAGAALFCEWPTAHSITLAAISGSMPETRSPSVWASPTVRKSSREPIPAWVRAAAWSSLNPLALRMVFSSGVNSVSMRFLRLWGRLAAVNAAPTENHSRSSSAAPRSGVPMVSVRTAEVASRAP